jgi:hypothetical protein
MKPEGASKAIPLSLPELRLWYKYDYWRLE